MSARGMGKVKILDRSWLQRRPNRPRPITKPTEIRVTRVLRYGNGWIEVQFSDGSRQRREGGTLAWRYVNPGNIKYGQFARMTGAVGKGWGGHAIYPNYAMGRAAKYQLLFTSIRGYNKMSLKRAINKYAPSSDGNKPHIYVRFLVRRVNGVNENTLLKHFTEAQRQQLLDAMQLFEGYKTGRIKKI